jgi:hypothetical protein
MPCAWQPVVNLLRTNLEGSDPAELWTQYVQLTEAVFRTLKSDLAIRPKRVEDHIMVAFLGYCLWVCLKHKLKSPRALPDPMAHLINLAVSKWCKSGLSCARAAASAWSGLLNPKLPRPP